MALYERCFNYHLLLVEMFNSFKGNDTMGTFFLRNFFSIFLARNFSLVPWLQNCTIYNSMKKHLVCFCTSERYLIMKICGLNTDRYNTCMRNRRCHHNRVGRLRLSPECSPTPTQATCIFVLQWYLGKLCMWEKYKPPSQCTKFSRGRQLIFLRKNQFISG